MLLLRRPINGLFDLARNPILGRVKLRPDRAVLGEGTANLLADLADGAVGWWISEALVRG